MKINKAACIVIFGSFAVTSLVSTLFALGGYLLGKPFWACFWIFFAIQMIVGQLWNYLVDTRAVILNRTINMQNQLAQSLQNVELFCAYCRVKNVIQIAVGRENSFKCIECNSENKVIINMSTCRITQPVVADKTVAEIFSKVDELSKNPVTQSTETPNIEVSRG